MGLLGAVGRPRQALLSLPPRRQEGAPGEGEQEAIRDDALARDPWFDHAEAALQIGIVLTSVAILTSSIELMYVSLVIAIVGLLCTVNGFTLIIAAELP